jgi:FkbM family methyltransferase
MAIGPKLPVNELASGFLGTLVDGHRRHPHGPLPQQLRMLHALRRRLVRLWDPTVSAEIYSSDLLLPFSHNLPLYLVRHPCYGKPLQRLARSLPDDGYIMDIGANVGDTAVLMRSASTLPIVCVEGDSVFLRYLRANVQAFPQIDVCPAFLESGEPLNAVVRSGGSARLGYTPSRAPTAIPTKGLEEVHREFGNGKRCVLVKIDTDGLDLLILHHGLPWVERERPVLFLEYDPILLQSYSKVSASRLLLDLGRCGYVRVDAFTNFGTASGSYALMESDILSLDKDLRDSDADYFDLALFPSD